MIFFFFKFALLCFIVWPGRGGGVKVWGAQRSLVSLTFFWGKGGVFWFVLVDLIVISVFLCFFNFFYFYFSNLAKLTPKKKKKDPQRLS